MEARIKLNNTAYHFLLTCATLLVLLVACKPGTPAVTSENPPEIQDTLPADFIEFYQRFHSDSAYQMQHIVFPVEGRFTGSAGQDSTVYRAPGEWKIHRAMSPNEDWQIDFVIPAEGIVTEIIYARDRSFWMERRFAKSSSEWFLIYFTGLQSTTF